MEIIKFIYNEKEIEFEPSGKDNVMVNATQMAKVFGKEIKHFNDLDSTKKFIETCLNYASISRESRLINLKISEYSSLIGINKKDDLIISRKNSGTWMHRILALKFAAWLEPEFEVWVFDTIDRVMNHFFRLQRDAMIEKLQIQQRRETKKRYLLTKYPEMADYFELEQLENEAMKKQKTASRSQLNQLRMDFYGSETEID